jgi:hypothetical protein
VAHCFHDGWGVEKDSVRVAEAARQGSDQHGSGPCMSYFSYLLYHGYGVKKDWTKHLEVLRKGVAVGDVGCLVNLAASYRNGNVPGLAKNSARAMDFYAQAYKRGSVRALYWLANCYKQGDVKQDFARAFGLYSLAAEKGHQDSIYEVASCLVDGRGTAANVPRGMQLLHELDSEGFLDATRRIAAIHADGKNGRLAMRFAQKAADTGNAWAIAMLADFYDQGVGTPVDLLRAMELHEQSAAKGNLESMLFLVKNLTAEPLCPYRVQVNLPQLLEPFIADDNNVEAMHAAGVCHEKGLGVIADPEMAFALYETAADQLNHPESLQSLIRCYMHGIGTAKRLDRANELLALDVASTFADLLRMELALEYVKCRLSSS